MKLFCRSFFDLRATFLNLSRCFLTYNFQTVYFNQIKRIYKSCHHQRVQPLLLLNTQNKYPEYSANWLLKKENYDLLRNIRAY